MHGGTPRRHLLGQLALGTTALAAARRGAGAPPTAAPAAASGRLRLRVSYEHEGFGGSLPTELRPMGETPADEQRTIAFWLNYRRG